MRPQPNRLPTRLGVAAAAFLIAGAALPAAATADPISSVVVFGDSSSDLGSQGLARRPTNLGQMWSERLAGNLGLTSTLAREFQITPAGELKILKPGGANYAVNGSTVLDFDCCISLSQQIDFFVEDRKRFKGDELVFLYFDRNDVETAFGDGLPYSASAFADEYIKQVKRLKALGARNIFAVGWELDLIPAQFGLDSGRATPETLVALRSETLKQRQALFPRLKEQNVFLVDLNTLGQDILAKPTKYGFTQTTNSYQQQGNPNPPASQSLANDGNVFTLDGHFTSAAQAVVADYTLAQLRARDQYASLLTQTALDQRGARDALRTTLGPSTREGWEIVAAPLAGRIDQQADGRLDRELNQTYQGFVLSARRAFGNGLSVGGGVALRALEIDSPRSEARAKGTAGLVSLSVAKTLATGLALDVYGAYGATDFSDIERRAALGLTARERATGSTDGRQATLGLGLTAEQEFGGWLASARIGAELEKTSLNGYAEKPGILALHYGDSDFKSALGRFDLRLARSGEHRWRPYLIASVTRDFTTRDITVKAGPTRDMIVDYASRRGARTQISGAVGLDVQASRNWTLGGSITGSSWSGKGGEASAGGIVLRAARTF